MAHLGYPLLGDTLYGERANVRFRQSNSIPIPRQMLHARSLAFTHPRTGLRVGFEAAVPSDFLKVLEALREPRSTR
jgi:23S rRNA pseudouridine1911/1915/1917 synthase